MAIIPAGISQFVYSSNAPLVLDTVAWKNNVIVLYTVNPTRSGWLSYKPTADFPTITQLQKDTFYIIESAVDFDLPGAKITS